MSNRHEAVFCHQWSAIQIKRIDGGDEVEVKKVAFFIGQIGENQKEGLAVPGGAGWWGNGCPHARSAAVGAGMSLGCELRTSMFWLLDWVTRNLLGICYPGTWYTELHRTLCGLVCGQSSPLCGHYSWKLLSEVGRSGIISSISVKMENWHLLGDCPESDSGEKDEEFLYLHLSYVTSGQRAWFLKTK